ncbi:hypothetical protein HanPSC8_Chr03g0129151 [Helianthus annuus]|nr:hypothetical protein HanPSC8_Chr03g0129151 [Helianthus annuus]
MDCYLRPLAPRCSIFGVFLLLQWRGWDSCFTDRFLRKNWFSV